MKDNRFQLGYRTPLVVRLYNSIKANLTESRATFFNPHPFPAKEFDEAAFFHCVDEEASRLFCPNRWKVIQMDWKYNKGRHVHLLSLWLVIYSSQILFLVRSMQLPTSADFVFTWQEMKQIRPKLSPLFYGSGSTKTIPDSAIKVVPWYHLEAVFHQYVESNSASC